MHSWGDEWFRRYGDELSRAISLFTKINWYLRGPFFLAKEKFGTMRLEYFVIASYIDCVLLRTNPIYIENRILYKISLFLHKTIFRWLGINKLLRCWQVFIFNMATLYTAKKFPHLVDEITDEFEFNELLYEWVKRDLESIKFWNIR